MYKKNKIIEYIKTETLNILNDKFNLNIDFYKIEKDSTINYFNQVFSIKRKNKDYRNRLINESERLTEVLSTIDSILFVIKEDDVVLHNNQFTAISFPSKSTKISNVIKYNSLLNKIKQILNEKNKQAFKEEIFIQENNKFYLLESHKIYYENSILFNLRDITSSKQFENIQKAFISNVSHELKTPLTNIKGYTIAIDEFIKDKNIDNIEAFFKIIYSNINKLEELIQDFLTYSKYETTKIINKTFFNFNLFIDEITNEINFLIQSKNVIIEKKFINDELIVFMDKDKMKVVLKNIIENGIIYNNNEFPKIIISFSENIDSYIISINDNGIGISSNEKEKIFDRFYRINEARPINMAGSGLGLSIVNEILKNYNGYITFDSNLGIGTTFKLLIPK